MPVRIDPEENETRALFGIVDLRRQIFRPNQLSVSWCFVNPDLQVSSCKNTGDMAGRRYVAGEGLRIAERINYLQPGVVESCKSVVEATSSMLDRSSS